MNLLRQLEDTTKSKIKIDFLVLSPVALYDLWILESVLSPIFDGGFLRIDFQNYHLFLWNFVWLDVNGNDHEPLLLV